ncbi:MAG TPA: histidinol-phosphate aminotransferase family protein, partial [Syntrophothermus lipocalidus]|nr:histidinol-phosphate aminotransferase family protein [Syntrophothermus lipocalidus]
DLVVFPPAANFVLCRINRPDLDAARLKALLLNDGFLIRDASNFRGLDSRFIRIAIKSCQDNQSLITCLKRYLS